MSELWVSLGTGEMLKVIRGIAPILMGLFVVPGIGLAGDYSNQVWTYLAYEDSHPSQGPDFARFNKLVQSPTPPIVTAPSTKPISIVMVYPGKQVSDYWRRSQQSFEARMKQAGIDYTLDVLFTQAATDVRKQESFINRALRKKPDYMVYTLDAIRHKTVVERIIGRSSTKLILQNITTPLKAWEGSQPFLYVGFDHEIGSKMLAERYIELTKGEGNYAVLFGPPGYVSEMRGDTFIQHVSKNSNLRLSASYYVGFDRSRAKVATLDLVSQSTDLKFIYAASTDIALGAIDALRERNLLGKIMVNGWGGGSAELEALQNQDLDFTVMRMNDDNGVAMADAIVLDRNGQTSSVPLIYSGEIVLITKDQNMDVLNDLKKQAFRYSDE
ncbi:MAG: substrate-binding domain-containing protein [Magnetovibrio sp.]|nr:substrate-binding domain-containing protein [Magnetovibrio sp.]